jgi:hypothetical protein
MDNAKFPQSIGKEETTKWVDTGIIAVCNGIHGITIVFWAANRGNKVSIPPTKAISIGIFHVLALAMLDIGRGIVAVGVCKGMF